MAVTKVSELTELTTPADDDEFLVTDTSEAESKKITFANLKTSMFSGSSNLDIDTGTETVDSFADTLYEGCMWFFSVKSGVNSRAGIVIASWVASTDTIAYSEMVTGDVGDTSDLTLAVDISSNLVRLRATAGSDNWSVKSLRFAQ